MIEVKAGSVTTFRARDFKDQYGNEFPITGSEVPTWSSANTGAGSMETSYDSFNMVFTASHDPQSTMIRATLGSIYGEVEVHVVPADPVSIVIAVV